jgi:hypothetical protein
MEVGWRYGGRGGGVVAATQGTLVTPGEELRLPHKAQGLSVLLKKAPTMPAPASSATCGSRGSQGRRRVDQPGTAPVFFRRICTFYYYY